MESFIISQVQSFLQSQVRCFLFLVWDREGIIFTRNYNASSDKTSTRASERKKFSRITWRSPVKKAVAVLNAVAAILPSPDHRPRLDDPFFAIGGDSLNMVLVIEALLHADGYRLPVTAFSPACTLRDLVHCLQEPAADETRSQQPGSFAGNDSCQDGGGGQLRLRSRYLRPSDRDAVVDMISCGFAGKGDLELALGDVTYDVMRTNLEAMWPGVLEAGLSIVVYEATNRGDAEV
jgi:hypothetical protein